MPNTLDRMRCEQKRSRLLFDFRGAKSWARHGSNQNKNPTDVGYLFWCRIVDALQTSAMLAQEDSKLRYLAEQFQLKSNLV